MSNVTKFPNSGARRDRQNLKNGVVECQVSGRWLQFSETSSEVGGKEFMCVDVMTHGSDDRAKKICEMVIAKEDLFAMLAKIKSRE